MSNEKTPKKITTRQIFVRGSLIAIIITIPSLIAFFVGWHFLQDLISAAIVGTVVHFIGLALTMKFSKKIFSQKSTPKD